MLLFRSWRGKGWKEVNVLKFTILDCMEKKRKREKITMLTAYDYTMAKILDEAGIDMLLVGDSLGMVIQGYDSTIPVKFEEILYHVKIVSRAAKRAMVIADMPFLSYQVNMDEGVRNAGLLIKEGGADAVKIEGGRHVADLVKRLVSIGIPVMGHLGLTPQSIKQLGGWKVQGKTRESAMKLVEDAKILEKSGVFSIVLEAIPWQVAKEITESINVPTIGIGAGKYVDGQVLVTYDMLGLVDFKTKYLKKFAELKKEITSAVKTYIEEVINETYPDEEHSYSL